MLATCLKVKEWNCTAAGDEDGNAYKNADYAGNMWQGDIADYDDDIQGLRMWLSKSFWLPYRLMPDACAKRSACEA